MSFPMRRIENYKVLIFGLRKESGQPEGQQQGRQEEDVDTNVSWQHCKDLITTLIVLWQRCKGEI